MTVDLELFGKLKAKLGEEETKALLQYLDTMQQRAKADIEQVKKEWVSREILRAELAEQETRIIRWIFAFMIGQVAVLAALVKFL